MLLSRREPPFKLRRAYLIAKYTDYSRTLDLIRALFNTNVRDNLRCEAVRMSTLSGQWSDTLALTLGVTDNFSREFCCVLALTQAAKAPGLSDAQRETVMQAFINLAIDATHLSIPAVAAAAYNNQEAALKVALATVSDPTVRDECCQRAIAIATERGHWRALCVLADTVTDQGVKSVCYNTILSLVIKLCDNSSVLNELLKRNFVKTFDSSYVLHILEMDTIHGLEANLTLLLHKMPNTRISSELLRRCIAEGHVSLANNLLQHASDIDQLGEPGDSSCLMLAASSGNCTLVVALLQRGASVELRDASGRTALCRASQAGHREVARALISQGGAKPCGNGECSCGNFLKDCLPVFDSLAMEDNANCIISGGQIEYWLRSTCSTDSYDVDRMLSRGIHELLNAAGFTSEKIGIVCQMADFLEDLACQILGDDRRITGSFGEGWGSSLVQVDGRIGPGSDIDWTVMLQGRLFHLQNSCPGGICVDRGQLQQPVDQGHVKVFGETGNAPAQTSPACGTRPAQDTCQAYNCCSSFCNNKLEDLQLPEELIEPIHLVRAARPKHSSELRISFSFQEKAIMRRLSTVEGQLFVIIKYILKVLLPEAYGLKSYHAKTLLLHVLAEERVNSPEMLVQRLKDALDSLIRFLGDTELSSTVCMPHYFMHKAPVFFRHASLADSRSDSQLKLKNSLLHHLLELRANTERMVIAPLTESVHELVSHAFYFHPLTLLPLKPIKFEGVKYLSVAEHEFAAVYTLVLRHLTDLEANAASDYQTLITSFAELPEFCATARLCLTVMAHLKFGNIKKAREFVAQQWSHPVQRALTVQRPCMGIRAVFHPGNYSHTNWIFRFCYPATTPHSFLYLTEVCLSQFRVKRIFGQPHHFYVNFRCLWWCFQVELRQTVDLDASLFNDWFKEVCDDPDFEELRTLAYYSNSLEHLHFCLDRMQSMADNRQLDDEEKLELDRLQTSLGIIMSEQNAS